MQISQGYRLITGLVARPWCLMEICSRQEIINIVTDPFTETTKIGLLCCHLFLCHHLLIFVLHFALEDEIMFVLDFHSLLCCGSDAFFVPFLITIQKKMK